MPSWPTRLHLGSTASNNVEPPTLLSRQERPIRRGHHHGIPREEEGSYEVPAPNPSSLPANLSLARPFQHGRSISQPFPRYGLVSDDVREKRARSRTRSNIKGDTEVRDGYPCDIAPGILTTDLMASTHKGSPHYGDIDLTKGKCATCDSLLRWPRQSDVFRCTVCLMVNDLKPLPTGQQRYHHGPTDSLNNAELPSDARTTKSGMYTIRHKVISAYSFFAAPYVSLFKTKEIIEDCITIYLKAHLGNSSRDTKDDNYKHSTGTPHVANGVVSNKHKVSGAPNDHADNISSAATQHQTKNVSKSLQSQILPARPAMNPNPYLADVQSPISQDRQIKPPRPIQRPPSRAPPPPPTITLHEVSSNPLENVDKSATRDLSTSIFRPLENYIIACFANCNVLNTSFPITNPSPLLRAASEGIPNQTSQTSNRGKWNDDETPFSEMDAKTLLLGDFAENGMWWTGRGGAGIENSHGAFKKGDEKVRIERANHKTPRIHWGELGEWYHIVLSAGGSWRQVLREVKISGFDDEHYTLRSMPIENQQQIEKDLSDACSHVQRTLLKASENLLRRPGGVVKRPDDSRFLFILLANPLLNTSNFSRSFRALRPKNQRSMSHDPNSKSRPVASSIRQNLASPQKSPNTHDMDIGAYKNPGIVKRILGLISNLPDECHHHLIIWLSRFPESQFRRIVDLVGGFVTHRLTRQHGRKRSTSHGLFGELVPSISGSGLESSAQLHAVLGIVGKSKASSNNDDLVSYSEDWQIRAAAKVMSLLCSANNNSPHRQQDLHQPFSFENGALTNSSMRNRTQQGQLLPTSTFYNPLLDYSDLVSDFETWESRRGKFSFCQYPMFLSVWAKIQIMEFDARRQMGNKAREAFLNSIMGRKATSQYLVLKVRRECLVEDSLRGVSEVVGAGQEEIKKELRIEFSDEEGIDGGG